VTLDELDEATSLSGRNLDIGDLAEALEKGAKFILSDVTRQASNEDSGVVRVGELVHGLGLTAIVRRHLRRSHLRRVAHRTTTATSHHGIHAAGTALILWSSGADAHGTVAAVDALHLTKSTLLVLLVGEANEAIAAGHARERIGHDLGGLARWKAALEEGDEDVFVDFGSKIADENGEFGGAVVTGACQCYRTSRLELSLPSISEPTTASPIELELT
jgi:hypothetical protein